MHFYVYRALRLDKPLILTLYLPVSSFTPSNYLRPVRSAFLQPVRNPRHFMQPQLCSQQPAFCHHSESDESRPRTSQPTSVRPVLMLPNQQPYIFPSSLLTSCLPTKTLYAFSSLPTCHTPSPSHTLSFYHPKYIW